MAHKILLALFLILSSYTSFSNSTCKITSGHWMMTRYRRTFMLFCTNITLNKETNFKEYKISIPPIPSMHNNLHIITSNISKLYDNTFDEFRNFEEVTIANSSLCSIEHNTFLNWDRLKFLNLSYNKLTSIDFYVPPNIMNLYITHNKISHLNLKTLHNIDNLNKLDLSYNSIISIENFGTINLRTLDLAHNNLSNLANITWDNANMLYSLNLSHNNLENVPKNMETKFVKNLDLSYNNISSFDCANVTETINLSYNKFNKICNFSKTIIMIDFSCNKVNYIYEDTFKNLKYLEYLNLSCNYIGSIYPGAFHDLINLEILDLSYNIISEIPRGLLYHLEDLRILHFEMNNIEKIEHGTFTGLNNLQFLNVNDNKINNLDAIYSLGNLRELHILNNNLYQLDVNQIIKHLPYLQKIRFNIPGITCEELMVYFLEFKYKNIIVEKGNLTNQENVNGIYCHSDSDIRIKKQETDKHRLEYVAKYLSGISVALVVILVVLVFVIISSIFTLYQIYVKHRKQTERDRNLLSGSLKLLNENDSIN